MDKQQKKEWLCRNCNSLVNGELKQCPHCYADAPEASDISNNNTEEEVVVCDNYTNVKPIEKAKYNFREAVLVNAADILLILGLFCTFAALIAPTIVNIPLPLPMMWAICVAIIIFAISMIQWALLRTIADISRRQREKWECE